MFPNPQDALPLPASPSIEQYRKLAKDLVKACRTGTIGAWTERWLGTDRAVEQVEEFARRTLKRDGRECLLADAQFVIARSHGFLSWPKFQAHLDRLAHAGTETADFEAAADAIISGGEPTLRGLLRQRPELIRTRSNREHNATLLHYISANGVEGYRQKSPPNAVRIAEILLHAGAEIDAEADVYGGGCTTLGLVATSTPPRMAGVQIPLMELLLAHGAEMEHPNLAGNSQSAVMSSLANGCPEAAAYFADRGATLDIVGAAGIGRLERVRELFRTAAERERETALRYAAGYGQLDVVKFLLDRGVAFDAHSGDGKTALFYAKWGGHQEVVRLIEAFGARPPS